MNEDSIKKIFRTWMGSSALQVYRDRALLDNVEKTDGVVRELNSLYTELEKKYNLLSNEEEFHVAEDELQGIVQSEVCKESVPLIGGWVSLSSDDVLICFENCLASLLEVFHVVIDGVKRKEKIH